MNGEQDDPGRNPARERHAEKGADGPTRHERLKAALRANMARRKAQARARRAAQPRTGDAQEQDAPD